MLNILLLWTTIQRKWLCVSWNNHKWFIHLHASTNMDKQRHVQYELVHKHVHIHTHTHAKTKAHMPKHTDKHTNNIHVHVHTYMHAPIATHTCTHPYVHKQSDRHTRTCTCTHRRPRYIVNPWPLSVPRHWSRYYINPQYVLNFDKQELILES